jgi:hypothetical protein
MDWPKKSGHPNPGVTRRGSDVYDVSLIAEYGNTVGSKTTSPRGSAFPSLRKVLESGHQKKLNGYAIGA